MKRWRILVTIGILLAVTMFPQPASKAAVTGQPVRIGLFYGKTAMQEVRLSSAGGLVLATLSAGAAMPTPYYSQAGQSSWMVRSDGYRAQFGPYDNLTAARAVLAGLPADATRFVVSENGKYFVRFGAYNNLDVALQVLNLIHSQPGIAIGPYRVNSAQLPDLLSAQTLRGAAAAAGFSAALAWSGSGWQVAVGHEASSEHADSLRGQLASALPAETWTVSTPDLQRSEVYSVEGDLLLTVPAVDLYFGATGAELGELENPPLVTLHTGTTTKRYRGFVELTLQSAAYRVLLYLTMDQYAMGVVPKEMSYSQPLEALKAQAVIVRTWAEANRGKHGSAGFDFDTTVADQAFTDYAGEGAPSQRAVIETKGMLLTYNGIPVATYYHADSGGQTEAVQNIWGGAASPWLVSVPELYPTGSPYASWEQRFTGAELSALLKQQNINIGTVVSVEATGYTAAGRVTGLRFLGSTGQTATLSGEASRIRNVNSSAYYALKSRLFTVQPDIPPVNALNAAGEVVQIRPSGLSVVTATGTSTLARTDQYVIQGATSTASSSAAATGFVFKGSGNGHGAGLSQWGAYAMAKNGHTYEEILKHYFQGTELLQLGD